MAELKIDQKTNLNEVVYVLSQDSRVKSVHAMRLPGVTKFFANVQELHEIRKTPPIPEGVVEGAAFDVLYISPPALPPSSSDKVYERK